MASTLRFSVEVAADQATQALHTLSTSFNQAGISAKSALLSVGSGSKAANDAVGGFETKLRSLKSEMAAGDRTINFFARSLNSIVPEASAAGQGLRLLADGLIGGVGLGLAIQGVMAILTSFGDALKEASEKERQAAEESKKYAAERLKAYQDADREFRKLQFVRGGGTAAAFDAQEKNTEALSAIAEAQKRLDAAEMRLATLRGSATGRAANPVDLQAAVKAVNDARAALAQELATAGRVVATGAATAEGSVQSKNRVAGGSAAAAAAAYHPGGGLGPGGVPGVDAIRGGFTNTDWLPGASGMIASGQTAAELNKAFGSAFVDKAKAEAEAKAELDKAQLAAQQLTTQIATTWIDALTAMVGETKITAQSMIKMFAQLAGQMMQMSGFALGGPLAGLAGALLGRALPRAHGGWDIPKGYGEVPLIAQGGEKVLSRSTSAKLDALMASGGGAAPVNVTINAIDGLSVRDWIVRNGTDFSAGVRELGRQGR